MFGENMGDQSSVHDFFVGLIVIFLVVWLSRSFVLWFLGTTGLQKRMDKIEHSLSILASAKSS